MAITKVTNRVLENNSVGVAQLSAGAVPTKLTSEIGALNFRNRVINGDMRVDQRYAGAAFQVTNNTFLYAADRFLIFRLNNNPSQVIFAQRQTNTSPGTPPGGANHNNPEHHYFIRTSVGTAANYTNAPGTIEQYNIQHRIEGLNIADLRWGTPQAKTITISFWVRSNYPGTYLINLSSKWTATIPYPSGARVYVTSYTINQANTWEKKTITITGDTTSSTDKWFFDNTQGVTIGWPLGVNNTAFQANGQSLNQWYTQSAPRPALDQSIQNTMMMLHNKPYINGIPPYFDLTGVQLEEGPFATPFEQRSFGTELALCQRYYESGREYTSRIGIDTYTNEFFVPYKVTKRVAPTLTFPYKAGQFQDPGPYDTGVTGSNVYYQYLGASYTEGFMMIWDPIFANTDAAPQLDYNANAELEST